MSKKIEDILIKAIKNPKTTFFKKYKVSLKNENLIREAYDIKKKYGKNTTRAAAIKKGYKRKKFVSTNNNYKSLLGS
ncbi:hypothetical protein [uncultured Mediterranean phage uvMED]|nr:hypothetical protein [uncultured Mediterranean phage uvMED]